MESTQTWLKRPPYWYNVRCHAGTGGCNGDVPGRAVGEVPIEVPEPASREEVWSKWWINTVPFGPGLMRSGWMSAWRPTRLLQPALANSPLTGANRQGRIMPENISQGLSWNKTCPMAVSKSWYFISHVLVYTQQGVLQSPQCLSEIDWSAKKSQVLKKPESKVIASRCFKIAFRNE